MKQIFLTAHWHINTQPLPQATRLELNKNGPEHRNEEADKLARQFAQIDRTVITEAVITALSETIARRMQAETSRETARQILARRGLSFRPDRKPVLREAYHDLDHDLSGESRCLSMPARLSR